MTNGEKFTTTIERILAFTRFCNWRNKWTCKGCPLSLTPEMRNNACQFAWLDLKYKDEEKPLPCPFCGEAIYISHFFGKTQIECKRNSCGYKYRNDELPKESDVIAAHNRVCKAVAAYSESEVEK